MSEINQKEKSIEFGDAESEFISISKLQSSILESLNDLQQKIQNLSQINQSSQVVDNKSQISSFLSKEFSRYSELNRSLEELSLSFSSKHVGEQDGSHAAQLNDEPEEEEEEKENKITSQRNSQIKESKPQILYEDIQDIRFSRQLNYFNNPMKNNENNGKSSIIKQSIQLNHNHALSDEMQQAQKAKNQNAINFNNKDNNDKNLNSPTYQNEQKLNNDSNIKDLQTENNNELNDAGNENIVDNNEQNQNNQRRNQAENNENRNRNENNNQIQRAENNRNKKGKVNGFLVLLLGILIAASIFYIYKKGDTKVKILEQSLDLLKNQKIQYEYELQQIRDTLNQKNQDLSQIKELNDQLYDKSEVIRQCKTELKESQKSEEEIRELYDNLSQVVNLYKQSSSL